VIDELYRPYRERLARPGAGVRRSMWLGQLCDRQRNEEGL
jgi:hypothetical protein